MTGNRQGELVEFLTANGFVVESTQSDDTVVVRPAGAGDELIHLLLPEDLLAEYVLAVSRVCGSASDPLAEAASLTYIHVLEKLDTDHLDGTVVEVVGVRRTVIGETEIFSERRGTPRPALPAPPDGDLQWTATRPQHW